MQLSPYAKLLFLYLADKCDVAGLYEFNPAMAAAQTGLSAAQIARAESELTTEYDGERKVVGGHCHLWLVNFIRHQRNWPLNPENRAHRAALESLAAHREDFGFDLLQYLQNPENREKQKGLTRGFLAPPVSPYGTSTSKSSLQEGGVGETKSESLKAVFDEARRLYPGDKRGLDTEWANFRKKHDDWREVVPALKPAIEILIASRERKLKTNQFVPEWAMFQTWINQRRWEHAANVEF